MIDIQLIATVLSIAFSAHWSIAILAAAIILYEMHLYHELLSKTIDYIFSLLGARKTRTNKASKDTVPVKRPLRGGTQKPRN